MPFVNVYIHFVWSTKNRFPFLDSKELRQKVWNHIRENAKGKGIFVDFVNGYFDHCHCLVSMGTDWSIEKVIQLIKVICHWLANLLTMPAIRGGLSKK